MTAAESKGRLLVVDDSLDTRDLLRRQLAEQGYEVLSAPDVAQALGVLGIEPVDLVITDLKMPGASGLELVRHVRECLRQTQVIVVTGYPSIEGAVEAVKRGAEEYLSKPFTREELFAAVGRAMAKARHASPGAQPAGWPPNPLGLVADSEAMQRALDEAAKVAAVRTAVLITGESGTGKELLARVIHQASPRGLAPFVVVDCGLPEELLERQLFGALPDTSRETAVLEARLLDVVRGGTLFLRDVSELPVGTQAALLRVLESLEQAGRPQPTAVDLRVIAASDRDLRALVAHGAFLEDLLVRLGANTIAVPPLRERGDDVVFLAQRFLSTFARDRGKPVPRLSDAAVGILKSYPWPGNIGELRNRIQQLVLTTTAPVVGPSELPDSVRYGASGTTDLTRSLADLEAIHIRAVLASVAGNKTKAAEILGVNRKTLRKKLRHHVGEVSTA